jgi:hypothetical protein
MTGRSSTILIPHSPGTLTELMSQLRNAMISAEAAARAERDHETHGPPIVDAISAVRKHH